jgi:hypothetical protein
MLIITRITRININELKINKKIQFNIIIIIIGSI